VPLVAFAAENGPDGVSRKAGRLGDLPDALSLLVQDVNAKHSGLGEHK
jgi:hypothetical protein